MNILVVEDEDRVAGFVARGLKAEGHTLTVAHDGEAGLALAAHGGFDVVILDQNLPKMTGRDICRSLRASANITPVLMLTAMDAVDDRVEGLRAGADDYLAKPFAFDELIARVEALARRAHRFQGESRRITVGDLVFDRDSMDVTRGGHKVPMTAKELGILELLISRPGHVLSRERILSSVWGYSEDPLTNVVDVYIGRLRRKLEEHGPPLIETMRGLGYRFIAPVK